MGMLHHILRGRQGNHMGRQNPVSHLSPPRLATSVALCARVRSCATRCCFGEPIKGRSLFASPTDAAHAYESALWLRASARIIAAAFSAIAIVGELVLPEVMRGITDA